MGGRGKEPKAFKLGFLSSCCVYTFKKCLCLFLMIQIVFCYFWGFFLPHIKIPVLWSNMASWSLYSLCIENKRQMQEFRLLIVNKLAHTKPVAQFLFLIVGTKYPSLLSFHLYSSFSSCELAQVINWEYSCPLELLKAWVSATHRLQEKRRHNPLLICLCS